jgi:hypothetical protein
LTKFYPHKFPIFANLKKAAFYPLRYINPSGIFPNSSVTRVDGKYIKLKSRGKPNLKLCAIQGRFHQWKKKRAKYANFIRERRQWHFSCEKVFQVPFNDGTSERSDTSAVSKVAL